MYLDNRKCSLILYRAYYALFLYKKLDGDFKPGLLPKSFPKYGIFENILKYLSNVHNSGFMPLSLDDLTTPESAILKAKKDIKKFAAFRDPNKDLIETLCYRN